MLESNRDKVEALARALLKYETLDASDVDRIMHGDNITKPTVKPVPGSKPKIVSVTAK